MSYRDVYEKWLSSSALSEAEKEELRSISGDEKEIESRFFAPLEFGTAGLRGTMCVGLHQMNIHVIRHQLINSHKSTSSVLLLSCEKHVLISFIFGKS